MADVRNVLFIMCDQLRADYLGCAGHPYIRTPFIDALAEQGVRFTRAFCNAPVCGPSRASFYTGRYPVSHGANYNNFPLRVDEWTLADYLEPLGVRTALAGKTHMNPDVAGMERLGIDPGTDLGIRIAQTGFEPFERDDGLHPDQNFDPDLAYNRYLRAHGYHSENPWNDFANAAEDESGNILSGWYLRHAARPARVREEHSETPYMTDRAIDFIRDAGDTPWCLHLSYIKPHWPYIAPAPYHARYNADHVIAANRDSGEKTDPNPVVAAFMAHEESETFSNDACRLTVIPTYMGLVEQIDRHVGRLVRELKESGRWDDTLIVFTSDHGDFLGDHWLGEKELFYEESLRIPLIIRDPSASADGTRGGVRDDLVESVDLVPTFIDALSGSVPSTRLEGRSLIPLLRDDALAERWRDCVYSEFDYCLRRARLTLGLEPHEARGFMVRTSQWKFVYFPRHPPQLFDLVNDPHELRDLGRDPGCQAMRDEMGSRLLEWFSLRRNRTTVSDERIREATGKARERGYIFGAW
ncbi:MAG: phosphonate monoester hydrolase [Proteobacteria bacterium]|nr:MAG: phosphonate monoester hydrolase [Pseudomonadota bacterium]